MRTVAKAFIIDAEGNILLLHRSVTHPSYAHQPDLPGGIVEAGENSVEGLAREILEETGLIVAPNALQLIGETDQRGYNHDEVYVCHMEGVQPAINISWEHERPMWLSADEMVALPLAEDYDPYFIFAIKALSNKQ